MNEQPNIFLDLSKLAALGEHAIVGKTVRIRRPARVRIGAHAIIDDFTYIACGLTVGRYTHIGPNSTLTGGAATIRIGNFVNLAPGCRLIGVSNDYAGGGLVGAAIPEEHADQPVVGNITLADHVLLGAGTVVLPGTNVPEGVSTGALSMLSPKLQLEPWTLYAGIPARPIRKRESKAILEAAARVLDAERER